MSTITGTQDVPPASRTGDHAHDLYAEPFPDDVPTAPVESISLAKLCEGDETESRRVGLAMKQAGYFFLDLRGHEVGVELLGEAVTCCRLIKDTLGGLPVEVKEGYKTREELGAFDRGYIAKKNSADGSASHETYNLPATELLADAPMQAQVLPPWLATHQDLFRAALRHAAHVTATLLSVFEGELGLPTGALQELHDLSFARSSGTFLRLLRYPGKPPTSAAPEQAEQAEQGLTFPAHKDYSTLSLLFTWLGGLQVPRPSASASASPPPSPSPPASSPPASSSPAPPSRDQVPDEHDWMWVRPRPGHVFVNGGWLLEEFSNGAMRAGWHRVMHAPGRQAPWDKFSVLFGMRALDDAPMRPLDASAVRLPPHETLTCKQWTAQGIRNFIRRVGDEEKQLLPDIRQM